MFIDWTISVGNLIQIAAFLAVGLGAFFAIRSDIRILRHDMRTVEQRQEVLGDTMAHLSTVLTTVAVQDTRISMTEKAIDELRHGQGFVGVTPVRT